MLKIREIKAKTYKRKMIRLDYQGSKLKISANIYNGKGESIMFIHGVGCSKDSFRDVWNFSEFRNYKILTFDLLGFGDSSKPKDFSYTLEEHAEICKLLIRKFGFKKVNLIGHSMGGAISLLLIKKIPSIISSFINLEGNLIGEDCGIISRKAISVPYEEFKKLIFKQIKQKIKEEGFNSWYKWICKSDPYGFYQSSKSLVKWSDSKKLLDLFLKLKIKKAYICGDKNLGMPILNLIKNKIKIIPISNSSHFMMLNNPKEFYQRLLQFLEEK